MLPYHRLAGNYLGAVLGVWEFPIRAPVPDVFFSERLSLEELVDELGDGLCAEHQVAGWLINIGRHGKLLWRNDGV